MKMLLKTIGGSTAYGLNTPESDLDFRGVFINTEPAKILGLSRMDHLQKQETDDIVYYEVRKFFELLRQGNTGALEILFSNHAQTETTEGFEEIRKNRIKFVDTDKMYRCLLGYMQGERRLANGERTGQLGGKRKASLEEYGFSPKNATQLLRLAWCGRVLFEKGFFPVNVKEVDADMHALLFEVKTQPRLYTKGSLNLMFDGAEIMLKRSYEERKFSFTFDEELANETLRKLYLPYLIR